MKKVFIVIYSIFFIVSQGSAQLLDSLISYWKMDETSGTREDIHGSNDLTDNNTVLYGTGKISNGADFELTNTEYLSIVDNDSLSLGSDTEFTWSFWFNAETLVYTSGWGPMFDKSSTSANREFCVTYHYGAGIYLLEFHLGNGSTSTSVTSAILTSNTGVWYHIIVWHDPTANKIYLSVNNGTPAETAWSGGTYTGGTGTLYFGRFSATTSHYYDGIIDEVGFWKRVLTSDERTELYNSGAGLPYGDFTASGGSATPKSRGYIFN